MIVILLLILLAFPLFSQEEDWDDAFLFFETEGITITGTAETSQQISVVGKEDIENRNAADIADLLQDTLGLNIVRYGAYGNQTGINLRGFDSKRVAFLVDGVPVNSPMDGKFDITQIDLNNVEHIEVIYGGSDSKFNVSGALGGVINIITVKKQDPGWRFGGSVSNTSAMPGEYRSRDGETQSPHWADLLDTQNFSLFASYGGAANSGVLSAKINLFANRAQNHFLFTDFAEHVRRKDNNEVWDTGASVSAVYGLSNYFKIISNSDIYYSDRNFPVSGFSSNAGNQDDFSVRQSLLFDMPGVFRHDLASEFSVSWQYNRRDYTSPADVSSLHNQHSIGVINRWNWFPSEQLVLRSGFDYKFNYLDSTEIGNRHKQDGGIYLAAEWSPVKRFSIVPSVKGVFTSGNAAVIPKLGFLWNVSESLTVKNNYFRSFKFPDFEELYWSDGSSSIGNPDLLPEDGWGADIGAAFRFKNFLKLESVFFTQWIRNSIHWYSRSSAAGSGIWRPENVGEAVYFGLENRAGLEIPAISPLEKITLSLSYQYLRSYLLSFGYTFGSDKRIPYNPEHTIGGSLDVFWKTGSFLISGHYESVRYNDRANATMLKSYFLLNAGVNQEITKNICAFGSVKNILNTSYESFYGYPMPGISFTLGMRVNL